MSEPDDRPPTQSPGISRHIPDVEEAQATAPPRHIWGPRTSRVPYTEHDLTFCLHVYHDCEPAAWCLQNLREVYPKARIVLISDGDPDPRYGALAQSVGARYERGERLFTVEHGGRLLARLLDIYFEQPTRWLFKIDPDTGFYRRFRHMPGEADIFGDWARPELRCLQGGCIGISRPAAARLRDSGLLLGTQLREPRRSWARHLDGSLMPACLHRAEVQGLMSFDFVLAWCSQQLDLKVEQFLEIRSEWTFRPSNPNNVFAVVHPIKDMRL